MKNDKDDKRRLWLERLATRYRDARMLGKEMDLSRYNLTPEELKFVRYTYQGCLLAKLAWRLLKTKTTS